MNTAPFSVWKQNTRYHFMFLDADFFMPKTEVVCFRKWDLVLHQSTFHHVTTEPERQGAVADALAAALHLKSFKRCPLLGFRAK